MAEQSKTTIYVDVDDEITNVIDKVLDSSAKVIALVLPKRPSIFQSTVNMKLLKRKSQEANKKVVLVTSEANLLPLAGGVGLFVAKTLNSKPEIPSAPVFNESIIEADEDEPLMIDQNETLDKDLDLKNSGAKTIAQLSPSEPLGSLKTKLDKDLDTIDLDNTELNNQSNDDQTSEPKPKKTKKDKKEKIKIPNFRKFKIISVLVILILLIGILGYVALSVLPSATIDISTDSSNVNANVSFTMDPSTSSLNLASNTVPAKQVKVTKTYSATVNSSGQQNNGTKATGQVTFTACYTQGPFVAPSPIPAGTGITQNNLTYVTNSTATFNPVGNAQGTCVNYTTNSVNITAQQGGSSYNTQNNNTSFNVPGYTSGFSATGGASGGTDNIITVVSQNDITNAQNKISPNSNSTKSKLSSQLTQDGYFPISMTFNASQPTVSENNQVGSQNSSVTVTESITYTMYGVFKKDLNTLLNNNVVSQVGSSESVLSTGISNANFSFTNGNTNPTQITVQTTAVVGPNINVNLIKTQSEGKKIAQIKSIVEGNSNVTSVKVTLSPFYVSSAPNNPSKIQVHIAKPTKTVN